MSERKVIDLMAALKASLAAGPEASLAEDSRATELAEFIKRLNKAAPPPE